MFTLSSCTHLNESKIIEENIDISTFLWEKDNNIKYLDGSIESDLEQIQNLDIKIDDILDNETKIETDIEEVSEEDINELIDILFDTN